MRMRLYQLKDVVSACMVGQVFVERNDGPAVRSFYNALEDSKSQISQYPKDFELLCLGEYDDSNGVLFIGTGDFPQVVATGVEWVALNERKRADAES